MLTYFFSKVFHFNLLLGKWSRTFTARKKIERHKPAPKSHYWNSKEIAADCESIPSIVPENKEDCD